MKETMADFLTVLKGGIRLLAEKEGAVDGSSSPKASVSKAIGVVRSAAERVGLEWPDSVQSSAKRLKTEDVSEMERIPSEHRISINCGSEDLD